MGKFFAALALAGVLLLAPSSSAQTAGVPLLVRTGEVYTVRVEQTQSTSVAGTPEVSFAQVLALHIVDAESRIWRYTPVGVSIDFPAGAQVGPGADTVNWAAFNEGMSAFMRIATDVGFECRVNEFGRCTELSNWPIWRDRLENLVLMFDAAARMAPVKPAAEAAFAADEAAPEGDVPVEPAPAMNWEAMRGPLLAGLARVLDGFDARDAAASMVTLQPGAALQGRTLTRRQSVDIAEELEMPFGAPPLRYVGTLRLERIDRRANTATIVRRVALDAASARTSLQSMAQFITTNVVEPAAAAAADKGEQAPTGEAMMSMLTGMLDQLDFQYQETTTGTVDLATGMAREATTEFTLTLAPPGGAEGEPFVMRGRTIMQVTLGAPEVARLPRGE